MPKNPTVSKNLNKIAASSFINLNDEASYGRYLTKLSDEDAGKLQYGSLWEITNANQKALDNVKTSSPTVTSVSTPEGVMPLAQTTLQQRVAQQLKVNTLKIAKQKLFSASNTKGNIQSFFTGPRFRNVDTSSLKPDSPTDTILQNNRLTGYTEFSTLFNIDASKGIVQGNTPGGVKSNPIYEMLDTHHLRVEKNMDEIDAMRTGPLKPTKGTNYKLLEEAVRLKSPGEVADSATGYGPSMLEFRKTMVELVQTKINKGGKFKESTYAQIAMDPAKYKQVVLDVVDKPDNKFIRLPNRRDWLQKGKNRHRFINPSYDFPELPPVIPTRGFIGNLRNQWTSQLTPAKVEKGGSMGTETPIVPFNSNMINRISKLIVEKKGGTDYVSTEPGGSYFTESWNKVILTFDPDKLPRNLRGDYNDARSEGIRATDTGTQAMNEYIARETKRAEEYNEVLERKAVYQEKRAIDPDIDKLLEEDINYKVNSMNKDEVIKAEELADIRLSIETKYQRKINPLEDKNTLLQKYIDAGFYYKKMVDPDDPTREIAKKIDLSEAKKSQFEKTISKNKEKVKKIKTKKENDKQLKKVYGKIKTLKDNGKWENKQTNARLTDDQISDRISQLVNARRLAATNIRQTKVELSRKLTKEEGNVGRNAPATTTLSSDRGNTLFNISLDGKILGPAETNVLGFRLNPAPLNRAQTEAMVKGLFESKLGTTSISRADDPARIKINTTIINMFKDVLSTSDINKATSSKSGMGSFLDSPKAASLMETPSMQQALAQQLSLTASTRKMSARTLAKESDKLPRSVQAFSPNYITANLARAQKAEQQTIGFGRQAAVATPVTANVVTQQPFKQEAEYAIPSLLAGPQASFGPQKTMLEQTMGDIQSTLKGINVGNQVISENQSTQVKTYELPKGMESSTTIKSMSAAIGGLSANTKGVFGKILAAPKLDTSLSTNVNTQNQGLLAGLNLKVGSLSAAVTGQSTRSSTDVITMLSLGYKSKQVTRQASASALKQLIKNNYSTRVFPKSEQRLLPKEIKQGRVVPQRIFPIAPYLTGFDPAQDALRRRNMRPRLKKKKTWWQTPENWYEPYYWGGKNQTGTGYINFTGKEPGKVKKYEKRHFGIGVNDSPFGIKGKDF
tara:strand:- start:2138 stop:5536 length:3399 start_codon:yes stop_codon:yes gene_type:complete